MIYPINTEIETLNNFLKLKKYLMLMLHKMIKLTEQAYSVSSTSFQQSDFTFSGSPLPSYSHNFFIGLLFTNIRSIEMGFSWKLEAQFTKWVG